MDCALLLRCKSLYIIILARFLNRNLPIDSADEAFFRDSDKLLIVDAHPANAFTSQGVVFPIDFIIQHASNWMVKEIRELLR